MSSCNRALLDVVSTLPPYYRLVTAPFESPVVTQTKIDEFFGVEATTDTVDCNQVTVLSH